MTRLAALLRRLTGAAARGGAGTDADRPTDRLFLSVSDAGWRATLVPADPSRSPEHSGESVWTEGGRLSAADSLRRAVRTIPAAARARIGAVHLLVSDPAALVADNRFARVRATDPAGLREGGARLLGAAAALYGFQLFGRSSGGETARGVYAFAPAEGARDLLGALDSLAIHLSALVPAEAVLLASGETRPFAAIGVGANATAVLLADPDTGAVAHRTIPVGVRHLAAAMAEANHVPVREALAGLARRDCLPPPGAPDGSEDDARPATATEAALRAPLATLRAALAETVEYFAFGRLATVPERVLVHGEAESVRGLTDWLGASLGLPAAAVDPHARFVADGTAAGGMDEGAVGAGAVGAGERDGAGAVVPATMNLLDSAPPGLLRIGRTEYRFHEGRFEPDKTEAPRDLGPSAPWTERLRRPFARLPGGDVAITAEGLRSLAPPGIAALTILGALWLVVPRADTAAASAADALSAALAEDAAARAALRRAHDAPPPDLSADRLYWGGKLLAISRAVPPEMRLTKVAVAEAGGRERLVLEGAVPAGPADPIALVTGFVERLSADPAFARPGGAPGGPVGVLDGAVAEGGTVRFTAGIALGDRGVGGGAGGRAAR